MAYHAWRDGMSRISLKLRKNLFFFRRLIILILQNLSANKNK